LADKNRKVFREKVKSGTFPRSQKNFSEIGGNLKQGGNASLPQRDHCLRGMDAPGEECRLMRVRIAIRFPLATDFRDLNLGLARSSLHGDLKGCATYSFRRMSGGEGVSPAHGRGHKTSLCKTWIPLPLLWDGQRRPSPMIQWCISPCFRFPPISEKFFTLRGKFSQFHLFPKKFQFSSAKISDDLVFSHRLNFRCFSIFTPYPVKNYYSPSTLKIFPLFWWNVRVFYILCVHFVSSFFDHDAFLHHTMHVAYWTPLEMDFIKKN